MLLDPTDPQSGVTVIPDLDIYRSANVLVKHHGDDTLFVDARYMGPTSDERAGVDKPAPSSLILRVIGPPITYLR